MAPVMCRKQYAQPAPRRSMRGWLAAALALILPCLLGLIASGTTWLW